MADEIAVAWESLAHEENAFHTNLSICAFEMLPRLTRERDEACWATWAILPVIQRLGFKQTVRQTETHGGKDQENAGSPFRQSAGRP